MKFVNVPAHRYEEMHTNIKVGDQMMRRKIDRNHESRCAPHYVGNSLQVYHSHYTNLARENQYFHDRRYSGSITPLVAVAFLIILRNDVPQVTYLAHRLKSLTLNFVIVPVYIGCVLHLQGALPNDHRLEKTG